MSFRNTAPLDRFHIGRKSHTEHSRKSAGNARLAARLLLVTVLAAGMGGFADPASARKKKIVSNGCTMEQIQSKAAGVCIDKNTDDILNHLPTHHAVYCSPSGAMLCCKYDNQSGKAIASSCKKIGIKRSTVTPLNTTKGLQLK